MRKTLITTAAVVAVAAGGASVAMAGGDDGERQAAGSGADAAKAAALKLIPGATVNAVERDGEKGATWEVEVRRPDGSTVDVRLDAGYGKVAIDADSESQ
jgi:uncharacterized membrane protein YkoI